MRENRQACLESHGVEVDDVVPTEVEIGEQLEVPKDPLWDGCQAVACQHQGDQASREAFQVKCLDVRDLVVCKKILLEWGFLSSRNWNKMTKHVLQFTECGGEGWVGACCVPVRTVSKGEMCPSFHFENVNVPKFSF